MTEFTRLLLRDLYNQFKIFASIRHYIEEHEFRLTIKAIIVGLVVWVATTGLKTVVHLLFEWTIHLTELFHSNWVIFGPLLVGALLVALLSHFTAKKIPYTDDAGHLHDLPDIEGDGVERTIALYYSTKSSLAMAIQGKEGLINRWQLPALSLAIRKFVASSLTAGLGASGGLEASVMLIGEGLATGLFKVRAWDTRLTGLAKRFIGWWRPDSPNELQTLQLCSIAAAISTLIGAPFMGAFFATEVMYRRTTIYEKFIYTLVAAVTAHLVGLATGLGGHAFDLEHHVLPPQTFNFYMTVVGLSFAVSLVSLLFTGMHYSFDRAFGRLPNHWLRFVIGAIATGAFAMIGSYLTGHDLSLTLGSGETLINEVLNGVLAPESLLLIASVGLITKLFATSTTISSGGSAGMLVPSLFFGTMVAQVFAALTGEPIAPLVSVAMTASLVSLVHVPMSSLIFVVEAFGAGYLVPALISMIVSSLMAYDNSIYRTQRAESRSRELTPGYSIQRLPVPDSFVGHSIRQLNIQQKYEVNVVGLVDYDEAGHHGPTISPKPDTILTAHDELIVLGSDENIRKLWGLINN